jgi:hypothetical protein
MNYTSAMGTSFHQMASLIMATKPLDVITRQPTTETMAKMVEQMAQMIASVKTTAWVGCHGSLALVLDDADYCSITKLISFIAVTPFLSSLDTKYPASSLECNIGQGGHTFLR